MKIGIDIRSLTDNQYSGVSECAQGLLKSLFQLDTKNEYKLFYNSFKDVSANLPEIAGANVEVVHTRYPNKIFNLGMQKILKTPKLDKVLGVDVFFMPNIGFTSLSENVKKVITIHDLSFLRYPEFFSLRRRIWHKMVNTKKLMERTDMIMAVSENTKNDIMELCKIDAKKISVVPLGIGEEYSVEPTEAERAVKEISLKEKYSLPQKFIFSLSTVEPRKNIGGMIKAYELFLKNNPEKGDIEFVIAGGRGWKNKDIYDIYKNSSVKDKIKFIGYVDKSDKKYLYKMAEAFLYVSFYEGFGFPPLEAMASGCPVIASANSSLPEIVGKWALLSDALKINHIAENIKVAVKMKYQDKERLIEAKKYALGFSWNEAAKSYLKVFESL
jgi:glycosyltransferase involved in cell wall biosynthesis